MGFFFDQLKENGPYCNFLKLHLIEKHRKAWKRQEFGEMAVGGICWGGNKIWYQIMVQSKPPIIWRGYERMAK